MFFGIILMLFSLSFEMPLLLALKLGDAITERCSAETSESMINSDTH